MSIINDRILKVFKTLDIKQVEFADRIGVSQAYISKLFKDKSDKNPSERIIKIVISEFNVNEKWLRTGKGEMFEAISSDELDKLASKYNLNPLAKKIIETFVTLEENEMNSILGFIDKVSSTVNSEVSAAIDEEDSLSDEDKEVEAYRMEVRAEKKGIISSASGSGEGIG